MRNTTLFFQKIYDFQNRRKALSDAYDKELARLERFRGSSGFDEDLEKLNEQHRNDLENLRNEYRPVLAAIYQGMIDNVGKRVIKPPTADMLNIISLLRMKKSITLEELTRTAETVRENPLAISICNEIAAENGMHINFSRLCPEMSNEDAIRLVRSLQAGTEDFLVHDTTESSRRASRYFYERYTTPEQLTKRELFSDKAGCFREIAHLEEPDFSLFEDAVNGGVIND